MTKPRAEWIDEYFTEIERPLRRSLAKLGLQGADVDDLVQHAVERFLTSTSDVHFESPWQLFAYLRRSAYRIYLDRERTRTARAEERQLSDRDAAGSNEPIDTQLLIAAWFEALDDEEKQVVEARMSGLKWDEVAAELGHASSSQARVLYADALARLGEFRSRPVTDARSITISPVVERLTSSWIDFDQYLRVRETGFDEADDWWRALLDEQGNLGERHRLYLLRALLAHTGFHPSAGTADSAELAARLLPLLRDTAIPKSGWEDLVASEIITLAYAGQVEEARQRASDFLLRAARSGSSSALNEAAQLFTYTGLWPKSLDGVASVVAAYCESAKRSNHRWLHFAARIAYAREEYPLAVDFAREATADRRSARDLALEVDALCALRDYDRAALVADSLERCFDYDEDWILARRGHVELLRDDVTKGRLYLARAIRIHRAYPSAAGARFIAECYALLQRPDRARQDARRAARLVTKADPDIRPRWERLLDERDILRVAIRLSGTRRDVQYERLEERLRQIEENLGLAVL